MIEYWPAGEPAGIDKIEDFEVPAISAVDQISFSVLDNIRAASNEREPNPVQNQVPVILEEVPYYVWLSKTGDEEGHTILQVALMPAQPQVKGLNTQKEKYRWSVDTPAVREVVIQKESVSGIAWAILKEKFARKPSEQTVQKFTSHQLERLRRIMLAVNGVTGQPAWERAEEDNG